MTAPFRLRAVLAAASLIVAAGACSDPFANTAQVPVASATLVAVALTGTAPNSPSALLLRGTPAVISPEAAQGDFDLGVDIDASGRVLLYPVELVDRRATNRVGLQRVTQSYDSLARAPRGTYSADSAVTLTAGQVVAVRVPYPSACPYSASPYFYSKVVVDEVRLADRTVVLRATTDPNCGFRSFAAGVPKD